MASFHLFHWISQYVIPGSMVIQMQQASQFKFTKGNLKIKEMYYVV
jgi:hypothetical protein